MLVQPFGFLAPQTAAEFDPTLGGALEPAHWYDFTDSATMTFSGSKIIEMTSKGTISGSIAKGTSTKYTAAGRWIGPEYDAVNQVTTFSGSSTTHSSLARQYGSSPTYDLGFSSGSQYTTVAFIEPNWDMGAVVIQAISNKGNGSTGLPEEDSWVLIGNIAYAGNLNYTVDAISQPARTIGRHRLSYLSPSNRYIAMGYSGSSQINGTVGPWVSVYGISDGTDPSTGFNMKVTSTNTGSAGTPITRDGNNGSHENLTIGSRSRNNVYGGPSFRVRHVLSYKTILTDQQIDDLNASYASAYPDDNLNPLP